jgi:hypothetical protein
LGQFKRYDVRLYPVQPTPQEARAIFIAMNNAKHEKGIP